MKKILTVALIFLGVIACSVGDMAAQGRFGVLGGISFSNAEKQSLNRSTMNKYQFGVTYQLKLPFGLSVQPSLLYHVKGAKLEGAFPGVEAGNTCDLSVGYLEVPVSIQWGPDLLLFRPFVDISPYIGYGLNNSFSAYLEGAEPVSYRNRWSTLNLSRFEYGIGLGVGLEIWKFQLIGRYNWNLGPLSASEAPASVSDIGMTMLKNAFSDGRNFGGFTLSISVLF